LNQSTDGDAIYVATGTYTGTGSAVIAITKSITLYGGWDGFPTGDVIRNSDAYPTTLDGEGQRRVVFISTAQIITPTLEGLNLTNGGSVDWGGGAYIRNAHPIIRDCQVYSNTANLGGGGLYLLQAYIAKLIDSQVFSNTAAFYGGAVYLRYSDNAQITGNQVFSNTTTVYGGGISIVNNGTVTLTGNMIYGNVADAGGGVAIINNDYVTLINNMVLDNRSPQNGEGIYVSGGDVRMLHTTIARNREGNKQGVYVQDGATLWLTNTILVSHTVGIEVSEATAVLTCTLWGTGTWANDTDWAGSGTIITGGLAHNQWEDPVFVDPQGGDYHIALGSAAIDAGVNAGVTIDIDGDTRPKGAGYDIGADEFKRNIFLPLVVKNYP
jgi:hypothetical protein